MRPRVLLIAMDNWYGTSRLPSALRAAGFDVGLIAEPHYFVAMSHHLSAKFLLSRKRDQRGWMRMVCDAMDAFVPDFIVPADENAVALAQHLALTLPAGLSARSQAVLQYALGAASGFAARASRSEILRRAAALGIVCPPNQAVHRLEDALAFQRQHGAVMLKRDSSFGGHGVKPCHTPSDVVAAHRALTQHQHSRWTPGDLWARLRESVRAALFGADLVAQQQSRSALSVEAIIHGSPAFHSAVTLDGAVLAGISAEVALCHPAPTGPSTRVALHQDAQMGKIARRLLCDLGYSGFCGLDFIRRPDGALVLLELNQRPTSISHLGHLIACDLGHALASAIAPHSTSIPAQAQMMTAQSQQVVLFPQDWLRAPVARDRGAGFADIPYNEPAILAAMRSRIGLNRRRPEIAVSGSIGLVVN